MLPVKLLASLEGIKGFDKNAFINVHSSGVQLTSIRFNAEKTKFDNHLQKENLFAGKLGEAIPWSENGFYLKERPSFTFDPLFHAGCYYVQEASSMFVEEALKQTVDLSKTLKILDLCAAPGGKSTLIQSLITKDSLLVSNEVIRTRVNILTENLMKWGTDNVVVTQNDPRSFQKLEGYFDVIVVDAPCSGSGLFKKDKEAINEWSPNNVQLCSQRQQRIIADTWPSLKLGGILIYSTCSFSFEEDEAIANWINEEWDATSCKLTIDKNWGITEVVSDNGKAHGYRFWPDKVAGEGFFISCFRKKEGDEYATFQKRKEKKAVLKNVEAFQRFLKDADQFSFVEYNNSWYAVPKQLSDDVDILLATMNVVYFGVELGQIIRDELIPAHALALSLHIKESLPAIELEKLQALNFLGKREMKIDTDITGWTLARYQGKNLGWMKVLKNRINNYYPKEWRILKDPSLIKID